jgi:hypothetical protein
MEGQRGGHTEVEEDALKDEPDAGHNVVLPVDVACREDGMH